MIHAVLTLAVKVWLCGCDLTGIPNKEVARACHTCALCQRHVCTLLTDDLAQAVACSIAASKLDYCNAMLYGAPATTFDVLQ